HPPPSPSLFPYTTLFRSDLLAVPLTEDRTHLLLADRARVGDLIEMRRHDQDVTDVHPDSTAGLMLRGRLYSEMNALDVGHRETRDRKSTRLNSSHLGISY